MEKDNAHMMFGYRILFRPEIRAPYVEMNKSAHFKYEPNGYAELKGVASKYEQMGSYQTKRKILRPYMDLRKPGGFGEDGGGETSLIDD